MGPTEFGRFWLNSSMYRGMPPSAGACHTTDAAENPDCGRAGERSSTMTAIGWRAARAGGTGSPSRGAGTIDGIADGPGEALAATDGDATATTDGDAATFAGEEGGRVCDGATDATDPDAGPDRTTSAPAATTPTTPRATTTDRPRPA